MGRARGRAVNADDQQSRPALARRVAWNTAAQTAARITTLGFAFLATVLLTRHLGVDGYGDYTAVLVYVTLFVVFFDLGTYTVLVRELSQGLGSPSELVGKALGLRFLLALVVAGVAAGLAPLLYGSAGDERLRAGIFIGLFFIVFSAVGTTFAAPFQARLRMDRPAASEVISQAFLVGTIVLLVAADASFESIIVAFVAAAAVNAAVLLAFLLREGGIRLQVDWPFWRRLLVTSLPLGLALVLNTIYFRIDALLLSLLKESEEVGIYGLAYRFLEMATPFGYFFVASVFPPLSAAAAAGDASLVRDLTQRSFDVLAVAAIALVAAVTARAGDIAELVGGSEFVDAGTPLTIVIVGAGLAFVTTYFAYLLVAINRQRAILTLSAATLAFNVALNLVLIPPYGYVAAAAVATTSEALLLAGSLVLAYRHAGFVASMRVPLRALAAGAVMFVAALLLPIHVVPAILVAFGLYLVGLYVLRVHDALDLAAVVAALRR
ncbi:MAG: oligosaccharide flippase family protein [Gaiellaceae bacterium]